MAARTLLRTKEVSERTGVPENTLRWWRHIGQGPKSFRLGAKTVVYDAADVDRWLDECAAAGDAASA